jgi:hypothetical protein
MEYELARSFYSLARAVLSVELRGRVAGRMIDIQRSKSSRGFHPETVDLRSASSVQNIKCISLKLAEVVQRYLQARAREASSAQVLTHRVQANSPRVESRK